MDPASFATGERQQRSDKAIVGGRKYKAHKLLDLRITGSALKNIDQLKDVLEMLDALLDRRVSSDIEFTKRNRRTVPDDTEE